MKKTVLLLVFLTLSACLYAQISDFNYTDFRKADSIAAQYSRVSLQDIRTLSHLLTTKLRTPQEKFRAIYKWVCDNIENDYSLYMKTSRQRAKLKSDAEFRAWNKKFNDLVFRKLIAKQKTVCSGYAYLIRELALHAGMTCEIINGYGRTAVSNIGGKGLPNHTWNAIQLGGKWYLCDATWSSGAINLQESQFIPKFNEAYFLADPSLFIRNHYPLDSAWMLVRDKPSLHQFLTRPIVYSPVYDYNITEINPETFKASATLGEKFSIEFNVNGKSIPKATLQMKGPRGLMSVAPQLYRSNSGLYAIDHVFASKGKHVVHVLLDDRYAFTYSVKVE
jgi:hypothetical protein